MTRSTVKPETLEESIFPKNGARASSPRNLSACTSASAGKSYARAAVVASYAGGSLRQRPQTAAPGEGNAQRGQSSEARRGRSAPHASHRSPRELPRHTKQVPPKRRFARKSRMLSLPYVDCSAAQRPSGCLPDLRAAPAARTMIQGYARRADLIQSASGARVVVINAEFSNSLRFLSSVGHRRLCSGRWHLVEAHRGRRAPRAVHAHRPQTELHRGHAHGGAEPGTLRVRGPGLPAPQRGAQIPAQPADQDGR